MSNSFSRPKKQAKVIRLVGKLLIDVNGQQMEVSKSFKIQTDIAYSGMTVAEQETVLNAIATGLAGNADISFTAELEAEEVKSQSKRNQEPSEIDKMLAAANSKSSVVDLVDAVVRDDEAKAASTQSALDILGVKELPKAYGNGDA